MGTRHSLHKVYSYLNGGKVASLLQFRFFNIGTGYENSSAFLVAARCGHSYVSKKVKITTEVTGYAGFGDLDRPESKSVSGVLHASTNDRLRAKKEIKEYR